MTAIYHAGVVTIIPKYDLGHPNPAANVLNFQTAAVGLTVAQLTAIQSAFDGSWGTNWRPQSPSVNKYQGCWVIDMSSATGNQVTNSGFTALAGTSGSASWGDQMAALVSLRTPTRYRGGHGRIYIPGFNVSSVNSDGSTLAAPTVTAINNMWTSMTAALVGLSGAAGGPLNPIVWHKHGGLLANTVELVSGIVIQPTLATQRRRLRKVTRHRRA